MADLTQPPPPQRHGNCPAAPCLCWRALALLLLSILLAVSIGAVPIPMATVWGVAVNHLAPDTIPVTWSPGREAIIWDIRFPRAILAALVGAGLGLTGAALQAVTRNPLADPHLLGISSGGAFGAILALMHTGMFLGLLHRPFAGFRRSLGAPPPSCLASRNSPALHQPTDSCWQALLSASSSWRARIS